MSLPLSGIPAKHWQRFLQIFADGAKDSDNGVMPITASRSPVWRCREKIHLMLLLSLEEAGRDARAGITIPRMERSPAVPQSGSTRTVGETPRGIARPHPGCVGATARSALPRFETALSLIDDIDAALAPHDTVVAVASP